MGTSRQHAPPAFFFLSYLAYQVPLHGRSGVFILWKCNLLIRANLSVFGVPLSGSGIHTYTLVYLPHLCIRKVDVGLHSLDRTNRRDMHTMEWLCPINVSQSNISYAAPHAQSSILTHCKLVHPLGIIAMLSVDLHCK